MAKTSMKIRQARPAKFSTRAYTRCTLCGRPHSVLRRYGISRICPVDMFPNTSHVETVVLLSKENISTKHVRVEFNLEEMDMSGFKVGATYEEIIAWVQEKYGFHVTHLNIAQVKRKCGIVERENYNLPKSPDSRQPNTPKEKEDAIKDAFKHFNMI